MPRKQNTTTPASVSNINSRRKRAQATWDQIKRWSATICGPGDSPEEKTKAFLLLMDEIERSESDRIRIGVIASTAMTAAFAGSDAAHSLMRDVVEGWREQSGLSVLRAVETRDEKTG